MKKFFLALMAMMAIVMTSCKHETCLLEVRNYSSQSVIVLFSTDEKCSAIDEALYSTHCKPQHYWQKEGVKVNDLYAIVYVCTDMEKDTNGSLVNYKLQYAHPLNRFAGNAVVSVRINAEGMSGVYAEGM